MNIKTQNIINRLNHHLLTSFNVKTKMVVIN